MKKIVILTVIVAALGALTLGVVMAQDDTPETPIFPGFHGGMMGGARGEGYMAEYMHAAFADALGISEEEFETRMYAGETLWDIADSLGFDADEIAELHNQARLEALELAVEDGFLSQEQFDWMQERMGEYGGFGMGGYGMHGGGGYGMPGRGQGGGWGQNGGCPHYYDNDAQNPQS